MSLPAIWLSTIPQSSAERHIGPTLSRVHASAIAPKRLTRPYVGRRPVTPQNALGVKLLFVWAHVKAVSEQIVH